MSHSPERPWTDSEVADGEENDNGVDHALLQELIDRQTPQERQQVRIEAEIDRAERLERERLHEEHERQMAAEEGLDEEPRVWTAEEIREDIRELRARPLPPSPEEREAEVEREHEPLTAAEAELLFEHSAGKDLARRARRGDDLLS